MPAVRGPAAVRCGRAFRNASLRSVLLRVCRGFINPRRLSHVWRFQYETGRMKVYSKATEIVTE